MFVLVFGSKSRFSHNKHGQNFQMNEVSVRTTNPCEPKAEASGCSIHHVTESFFPLLALYDVTALANSKTTSPIRCSRLLAAYQGGNEGRSTGLGPA